MDPSTHLISDAKLALKSKIAGPDLLIARKRWQMRFVLKLFLDDSEEEGSDISQITSALLEAESKREAGDDMNSLAQASADGPLSLEELIRTLGQLVRLAPASMPTLPDLPAPAELPDDDHLVGMGEEIMVEKLSPREIDVLKLLMGGDSNKQIARKLNIAEPTVKCHVKSILRKLHARNRFDAAMWAMKMKLGFHGSN